MRRAFPPFLVLRVPAGHGRLATTHVYARGVGDTPDMHLQQGAVMPSILKTTRVYLDAQRRGVIVCVQCGTHMQAKISPEAGPISNKIVPVQCRVCHSQFNVRFDHRRHHRRRTTLPGTLWPRGASAPLVAITVTSLSAGGLSFLMARP